MLYKPLYLNGFTFIRSEDAIRYFKAKYFLCPHLKDGIIKYRWHRYELYKHELHDLYYRKRFLHEYISDETFENARERFAESVMYYNAALIADGQKPITNIFPNEGVTHDIQTHDYPNYDSEQEYLFDLIVTYAGIYFENRPKFLELKYEIYDWYTVSKLEYAIHNTTLRSLRRFHCSEDADSVSADERSEKLRYQLAYSLLYYTAINYVMGKPLTLPYLK